MPGPEDGGDHHAVLAAAHSGRVGLQQRRHGPKLQRPPAPSTLALIEAGAASPADPTATLAPSCQSHRHHDRVGLLIEADRFHDGVLDAEQPYPYPSYLHAVSPFLWSQPWTAGTVVVGRRAVTLEPSQHPRMGHKSPKKGPILVVVGSYESGDCGLAHVSAEARRDVLPRLADRGGICIEAVQGLLEPAS
jgi:hypothetical protein